MCAIYGIVGLKAGYRPEIETLAKMGDILVHRGPDDQGSYVGRGFAMGMRRLSIIDLAGGHQPIANENETVWVVCNGEIYNYRELRTMLMEKGHTFRSSSDTEVIAHLYEEKGVDVFSYLRGMFGVAIWDVRHSRLILGRDRLGKKPLYLWKGQDRLLFASEMKALLQDGAFSRRLNGAALNEYLALGYVPAPMTMLEGIEKLLPGHYLIVEDGHLTFQEYWDIPSGKVESLSEHEWVERIRDKFLESVRIRLVSDVPLGAFLSGGIDSSAVVAAMARYSDRPVKTYSIGFDGEDSFYNELPYARIVANAFGTDHHEIIVRPQVADLLPKLIWYLDEPIADSALLTTYLVSDLARQSVTVILSGVGGDELFGGYRRYLGDGLAQFYRILPGMVRQGLRSLFSRLPQDRHSSWTNYVRYAAAFTNTAELNPVARYMSYVTLFSPEARERLVREDRSTGYSDQLKAVSNTMVQYFEYVRDRDILNQMMYVDMKTSLVDDLLALSDRMTMAASIECRAPFMDHELVELMSRVPSNLKIHGLTLKYLLKKAVAPWLPKEILSRKKRGFGAPIGAWLRRSLKGLTQDLLSESQVRRRGLFDPVTVQNIIRLHQEKKVDCTDQLLALISLELWCQLFLDGGDRLHATNGLGVHVGQR